MEHRQGINVPGSNRHTSTHPRQPGSPGQSLEESNPDNRSYALLHDNDSFQSPRRQTYLHAGNREYDQEYDGLSSTGRSSSMYLAGNHTRVLDVPIEPHADRTSNSTHTKVKKDNLNESVRSRHIPSLWDWKWEILAMVTSLGLLAGILGTLLKYNHGEQPDWPYDMDINSLISIFTAIIIAQLGTILAEVISQLKWSWFKRPHPLQDLEHYDEASRGALGSILFLGRFALQPPAYLAVGAAFILLVSAAIGPFTQQSIKKYTCQQPLHNVSASIAAASYVNADLIVAQKLPQYRYPNFEMMYSVLAGLVGSDHNGNQVPFDCPTGDCDFSPYSSLAYCNSCSDITSHVQEQHGQGTGLDDRNVFWNYTLPDPDCRLKFSDNNGHPQIDTDDEHTGLAQLIFCLRDFDPWYINHKSATSLTILSTSFANCSRDFEFSSSQDPGCSGYPEQLPSLANVSGLVAMNCTLGLCVREYDGRVRNGVLDETTTTIRYPDLISDDASMFRVLKLPCIVDSKKYDVSNISQVPTIPGRNFTTIGLEGRNITAPLECVFEIEESGPWAINQFIQIGMVHTDSEKMMKTGCSRNRKGKFIFCYPWYLEPVFNGGRPTAATISSNMDRIAIEITNRIRIIGSNAYRNDSGIALGTANQTTVCVRVEWPWLLLPAILVLLTLFVFSGVFIVARKSYTADGQPIWKSSALVPFFHGIEARSLKRGHANEDAASFAASTREPGDSDASAPFRRRGSDKDLMTLESMQARAEKLVVKIGTTATGKRGFIMTDEEDPLVSNENDSQRRHSEAHRDGEALPLTQLPSNSRVQAEAPTYLQVDLGIGLTPSIRSSLDRSTQCRCEGSPERDG